MVALDALSFGASNPYLLLNIRRIGRVGKEEELIHKLNFNKLILQKALHSSWCKSQFFIVTYAATQFLERTVFILMNRREIQGGHFMNHILELIL